MYPMCTIVGFFSLLYMLRSLRPWLSLERLELDVPSLATLHAQQGCHSAIIYSNHSFCHPRRYSCYGHPSFSVCVPVGMCILHSQKSQVVPELTDQAPFEMCDPFVILYHTVATQHRTI